MIRFAALLLVALASSPACADESILSDIPLKKAPTADSVAAEKASVQAWGRAHPECAQWTDSCVVCTLDGCSTPGFACTPKETVCRKK